MGQESATNIARFTSIGIVILGVLSLLTSLYFTTQRQVLQQTLPATGGSVGPFEVKSAGTVLEVVVVQSLTLPPGSNTATRGVWSFVSGEVTDDDDEYLFGFGGELWKESGYDGSYWTEEDRDYAIKLTMPEAGQFFLEFSSEAPFGATVGPMRVTVHQLRGSAIPHFVLGIALVLLGLMLRLLVSKAVIENVKQLEIEMP